MSELNPTPRSKRKKRRKPKTNLTDAKIERASFILHSTTVKKLYNENPLVKESINMPNAIHKLKIQNTVPNSTKIELLKVVNEQAKHLIIPVNIKYGDGNCIEFYCMNCGPALCQLCEDDLFLKVEHKNKTVKLPITLMVGDKLRETDPELDTVTVLKTMLGSRISSTESKTLDLEKFNHIAGFAHKIYLDLSKPSALNFVVMKFRSTFPKVVNLSGNSIKTLKGCRRFFPLVESVDLSFNEIESIEDLQPLLKRDLKQINLSFNPIREKFSSSDEFKKKLKELFPNAEILESKPNTTAIKLLESCNTHNSTGTASELRIKINPLNKSVMPESAYYFVDQFMEHYFTYYDDLQKRRYLQEMYHSCAIFSLTSFITKENESGTEEICQGSQRYKHHAHNLLDIKSRTDYVSGPLEIIRKLCYLPPTNHNAYSFCVDLLQYVENISATFVVSGVFREDPSCSLRYYFTRTFSVIAAELNEFKIINELLYVSNDQSMIPQFANSFKCQDRQLNIDLTSVLPLPVPVTKEQRDGILGILIELTYLHIDPATEYLEKCQWNIRNALESIAHDVRFDLIGDDSFMQNEQRTIVFNHLPKIIPGINMHKFGKMLENLKDLKDEKYAVRKSNKKMINRAYIDRMIRQLILRNT